MNTLRTTGSKIGLFLTLGVIGVVFLFSLHSYKVWEFGITGGGDTWGYYLYLPATFIHHDLDSLDQSVKIRRGYHGGGEVSSKNPIGEEGLQYLGDGKYVNKYTLGLSILYAPFFFTAHLLAYLLDYPPDGYSFIYIYLIHLSSVCYVLVGLFFLYKVLRSYFSEFTTLLSLLTISFATNLYYFSVYNSAMSHAYLFFLYCLLLYFSKGWHQDRRMGLAIGIGITCGLITLIRPTEIICLLIPVFWGVTSWRELKDRISLLLTSRQFYAATAFFIVMGVPQLLYWKWVSGQFFFYSYTNEEFHFLHPQLLNGLFSFQNGWLAYTPVMYLALLGLLWRSWKKPYLLPAILFLPIHIYITYSWWCWNYVNGFGSRPMVETYALLSLPLAGMLDWLTAQKMRQWLAYALIVFFSLLNIFNTYQLSRGVLWSENANWPFYKGIFGKTSLSKVDLIVYDSEEPQPDTSQLIFKKQLYYNDFEDSSTMDFVRQYAKNGQFGFRLTGSRKESPTCVINLLENNIKTGDWIKVSINCMRTYEGNDIYHMSKLLCITMNNGKNLKWRGVRLDNKPGNSNNGLWGGKPHIWEQVDFWFKIPRVKPGDVFKTLVENTTTNNIYLDDHRVELWSHK